MQQTTTCGFDMAWRGRCPNPVAGVSEDSMRCAEHANEKCGSCGEPASRQCDQTGQFVCGVPLCDKCEHACFPDGSNGGVGFNEQRCPEGLKRHVRKDAQQYKWWYEREEAGK